MELVAKERSPWTTNKIDFHADKLVSSGRVMLQAEEPKVMHVLPAV